MVLRLRSKILEDRLLPVALHVIPVVDLAVPDRVVHTIARCLDVRESLIPDKEIKVLDAALRREMAGLGGYSGSGPRVLGGGPARRDRGGEYATSLGHNGEHSQGAGYEHKSTTDKDGSELPANLGHHAE
jgi:hypothetical protein